MNRRELLQRMTALSVVGGIPFSFAGGKSALLENAGSRNGAPSDQPAANLNPLIPPAHGSIPVAFVISEGAVLIDFSGPWEVFENVAVPDRGEDAFRLYTVAATAEPIRASGIKITPDYTFETAPAPKVIVIPAQNGSTEAMLDWIRKSTKNTDLTMSVCTGAFVLARTGLLSGRAGTTHHNSYKTLAMQFPDIHVKRGARFVEDGSLATAGGLSSGVDLALRVVERYFGQEVASQTAYQMEYQGRGWLDPNANEVYAKERISTDEHPICPVCEMDVDAKTAPKSVYQGKTYYFCMVAHKEQFDAAPGRFAVAVGGPME